MSNAGAFCEIMNRKIFVIEWSWPVLKHQIIVFDRTTFEEPRKLFLAAASLRVEFGFRVVRKTK
jgi:hypothetical protein